MPETTPPAAPAPEEPKKPSRVEKLVRIVERLTGKAFDQIDPESLPRIVPL